MQLISEWASKWPASPSPTSTNKITTYNLCSYKTGVPNAGTYPNRPGCAITTPKTNMLKILIFRFSALPSKFFRDRIASSTNPATKKYMWRRPFGAIRDKRRSIRIKCLLFRILAIMCNLTFSVSFQYIVWIWLYWWFWSAVRIQRKFCRVGPSPSAIWSKVYIPCTSWAITLNNPSPATSLSTPNTDHPSRKPPTTTNPNPDPNPTSP